MIGDLAGFVASTLQRGIRYIQIPTTLLSQVDSSVGGKVGIDHPRGKNLIGAFHQPSAVYIDPATLRTLPEFEFSGGMAEVIKYGAILDAAFFGYLERHRSKILRKDPAALRSIIGRCCTLKAEVVRRDEKESSYRRILNFGHTIGHAVEALSHFRIAHGQAVAIGMCCEAKIARELGLITAQECARLIGLIRDMRLPTRLPAKTNLDRLIERTKSDKKSRGGAVRYTLLEAIGRGSIDIMPRNIKQLIMR